MTFRLQKTVEQFSYLALHTTEAIPEYYRMNTPRHFLQKGGVYKRIEKSTFFFLYFNPQNVYKGATYLNKRGIIEAK